MKCYKCGSTDLRKIESLGFYICNNCRTQEVYDESKFDYDELVSCPDCWGTGLIFAYVGDSQPSKCSSCSGTGWLGL